MKRRKRFGKRLMAPDMSKIASELGAPGERGRAVPGDAQREIRQNPTGIPTPMVPAAQGRTEIATRFTKESGSQLLYQAESWVRLTVMLETAGPVAIGSRDDVSPPLSGKGILLPTDKEITFSLSKGNRIFIAATATNRVRVIIEPIPWMEQFSTMIGNIVGLLKGGR